MRPDAILSAAQLEETAASIAAMACGLSRSIAMMQRGAARTSVNSNAPATTSAAFSRISMSSQLMYGSHSAPLTISVLHGTGVASLSAVG